MYSVIEIQLLLRLTTSEKKVLGELYIYIYTYCKFVKQMILYMVFNCSYGQGIMYKTLI